jgi:hypothetical protein
VDDDIPADLPQDDQRTQWTEPAAARYRAATQALVQALEQHAELVSGRAGRPAELRPYRASTERLQEVMDTFRDAEFAFCGSVPFAPLSWVEEAELEVEEDHGPGPLVSVVHQVEFEVLDEAGLVEAGRAAYRQAWPADTDEDALLAITDVPSAVGELLHVHGWDVLSASAYLRPRTGETSIVRFAAGRPEVLADQQAE